MLLTIALAGSLVALLAYCRGALRGTTLLAVWWWAVAATLVVAANTVLGSQAAPGGSPSIRSPLNFAAAMVVFCPPMAVLGAKRPQNKPWQLIVLSLWAILALPGVESLVRGGEMAQIHPARSWFLAILLLVGAGNHLPTRYWLSAVLFAAGQAVISAPWLPVEWFVIPAETVSAIALGLWLAALLWAMLISRRDHAAAGLERVWSDFRDAYGAVWALRVIERVNAAGASYQWPVRLSWDGFSTLEGGPIEKLPDDVQQNVRNVLANMLRRFVSSEWIQRRMTGAGRNPQI